MKRIASILFSVLLLFSLTTSSFATGDLPQQEKHIKIFMDTYGSVNLWILQKNGKDGYDNTVNVDSATLGTFHPYKKTFTVDPENSDTFYILADIAYAGLYLVELNAETEKQLLSNLTSTGRDWDTLNDWITISSIEKFGKKLK